MRQKRIKVLEYYFKISRIWRKTGIKYEEKKIKFGIWDFYGYASTIGKEKIMKYKEY